jgi:hypothetical protein
MSSPIRPTGHSDWTEMPLFSGKQNFNLVDDLGQLLVAAKDDVVFLKVGGELHGHEGIHARGADKVVAPRSPGILAATHRAMADVDHVLDRTPHHALRAGISAAANRHHARNGLEVGLDSAIALAFFKCARCLARFFAVFSG